VRYGADGRGVGCDIVDGKSLADERRGIRGPSTVRQCKETYRKRRRGVLVKVLSYVEKQHRRVRTCVRSATGFTAVLRGVGKVVSRKGLQETRSGDCRI
jgi:hypothetical protein